MPKAAAKTGRPSRFNQALAARMLDLATQGKTDVQIAHAVGISTATLNNWKGKHPDFLEALKKAKTVADDLVEASLFQNAVGYSHPAVKFFFDSKTGKVITQAYVEHHKPDTTAQIFWLKNRRPDLWRDKLDHEHTGKDGGPIERKEVTVIQVENAIARRLNDAGPPSEEF